MSIELLRELERCGKITIRDVVEFVNDHETRQCSNGMLLEVAICSNCHSSFFLHGQALKRAQMLKMKIGSELYCQKRTCRQKLKADQNSRFNNKKKRKAE